jgi:hypothetical protein
MKTPSSSTWTVESLLSPASFWWPTCQSRYTIMLPKLRDVAFLRGDRLSEPNFVSTVDAVRGLFCLLLQQQADQLV